MSIAGQERSWSQTPPNNNWNNTTNWSSNNAPDTAAETALFGLSSTTSLVFELPFTCVGGAIFAGLPNAPAYTFSITGSRSLIFSAAGIVNNSTNTHIFNTNGLDVILIFTEDATAGTGVVINNINGGQTMFLDGSSANGATINNSATGSTLFDNVSNGGKSTINNDGILEFISRADARHAIINNNAGGTTFFSLSATAGNSTIRNDGLVQFENSSSAGNSTIINRDNGIVFFRNSSTAAASTINNAAGGQLTFFNSSSAGGSIISNSGTIGFFNSSSGGSSRITNGNTAANIKGILNFFDSSTSGAATIDNAVTGEINFRATSKGETSVLNNTGVVSFFDRATAQGATINNNSNGRTNFIVSSTAGTATINNNGADSRTEFTDTTRAGSATINNNGGVVTFSLSSTADNATFNNVDGGRVSFLDTATAGRSTISNSGLIDFLDSSNGGTSTINNNGIDSRAVFNNRSSAGNSIINNVNGGLTAFTQNSSAGNATINNDRGFTVFKDNSNAGSAIISNSNGSSSNFFDTSTAAATTITNNNALTLFFDNSTADQATINNTNSVTAFFNSSTAGNATLNNLAGGFTTFIDNSSAGNSSILNTNFGSTLFSENSKAGNALISNAQGSTTLFFGGADAATSTINNNGSLNFSDTSTAGSAVINNLAAGVTTFAGLSRVATSTINNNGLLRFIQAADVGNAMINNNGSVVFDQSFDTTYAGVMSGRGSLTKTGANALTLLGANTFSGGTFLISGVLGIGHNTALGSGNVTVSGGILQTIGTQRVINVGGNYTQSDGTLALSFGGAGDGQFDRVNVTGSAELGGTLQIIPVNGFAPKVNDQFKIITANRVSGQFANFINPFLTSGDAVRFDLLFNPQDVTLAYVQLPFGGFGRTFNQITTGRYLDQFSTIQERLSGDFGQIVGALNMLRADEIPGALNALSPQRYEIFSRIAFNDATFLNAYIDSRLSRLLDLSLNDEEARRGGFRITGDFQAGEFSGSRDIAKSNYRTEGFTSSYDYSFGEEFVLGGLFKLGHAKADLDQIGSEAMFNTYTPGIYAGYSEGGFFLNGLYTIGFSSYETKRRIVFADIDRTARGETDGKQQTGAATIGYAIQRKNLTVSPQISVQYGRFNLDGFNESGADSVNLNIADQRAESLRVRYGATVANTFGEGTVKVTPEIRFAYQHESLDGSQLIEATAPGLGSESFAVNTIGPDRHAALIGAGINIRVRSKVTIFADYNNLIGRRSIYNQAVKAGVRF